MAGDQLRYEISPLGSHHDRAAFSCGEPELDRYLKRDARQDQDRGLARVHVLTAPEDIIIIGFYTLSNHEIEPTSLPPDLARKLPNRRVPTTLLGRLAVHRDYQRQRFGERLVLDAFKRTRDSARNSGSYALIVDAKNEKVRPFYERFDFQRLPENQLRLFISLKTIEALDLP